MGRKLTELSSREDFAIEQFPTMKKINGTCSKLFDLYFIDIEYDTELSVMMRNMVPSYYVDPTNPEHPSCYVIAGQSNISYLERIIHLWPYVNEKNKYEYDISAYKGLVIPPEIFTTKSKPFRKSKLEPMVIMGENQSGRFPKSLVLREGDTHARSELILEFLEVPNRKREGIEPYLKAVDTIIYKPWYRYLMTYLNERDLQYTAVSDKTIEDVLDFDMANFTTEEGDIVTITKGILPLLGKDIETHKYEICKVPDPLCDTSGKRFHYIIKETFLNDKGSPYMTIHTLLAAMQLQ